MAIRRFHHEEQWRRDQRLVRAIRVSSSGEDGACQRLSRTAARRGARPALQGAPCRRGGSKKNHLHEHAIRQGANIAEVSIAFSDSSQPSWGSLGSRPSVAGVAQPKQLVRQVFLTYASPPLGLYTSRLFAQSASGDWLYLQQQFSNA
ncbi:unnamed protein product [Prorocentrum cordatum]|uniref:Uncharacterized protein n=1 Tax=Prorocentrum cordatum TaxID=2364126 RepID=A0ABN9WGM2_9DINO|nr:unnamed protein product [Polarella glacialis]